jgi:NitT/TauT family transport system substrate-binding protein
MKRNLLTLLVSALVLVAAIGVTSAQEDVATVRVQLGWVHEYSAAGFYMAGANGHYGAENLNVELLEGGFGENGYIDPIANLLAGEADFANTDLLTLMEARAQGMPIVALATINQRSPSSIISMPEQEILTPEDLVGKTVAVAEGGARIGLEAMLGTVGIDPADVNIVDRTDFGVDPLINGDVDALGGWIINEGVLLEEAGYEPNYIVLSDYGVDTYNTLIVTTEDMIANNPDVVERFLRATIQGHEDVIADPDKAAEVTLTYDPELVYEEQFNRINAFLPLMKPAGSQVGVIVPEVFDYNQQMLLDAGVLEAPLEDLSAAYDLSFLEAIYGELEQ